MAAFGSTTVLSSGTLTLASTSGQQWFFIQNQDTAPLTVQFKSGSTVLGQIILEPATATGRAGGYLDSVSYPIFLDSDSVVLTSTIAANQIGSGASKRIPTYIFFTAPPTSPIGR